jgi:hypothetical protein
MKYRQHQERVVSDFKRELHYIEEKDIESQLEDFERRYNATTAMIESLKDMHSALKMHAIPLVDDERSIDEPLRQSLQLAFGVEDARRFIADLVVSAGGEGAGEAVADLPFDESGAKINGKRTRVSLAYLQSCPIKGEVLKNFGSIQLVIDVDKAVQGDNDLLLPPVPHEKTARQNNNDLTNLFASAAIADEKLVKNWDHAWHLYVTKHWTPSRRGGGAPLLLPTDDEDGEDGDGIILWRAAAIIASAAARGALGEAPPEQRRGLLQRQVADLKKMSGTNSSNNATSIVKWTQLLLTRVLGDPNKRWRMGLQCIASSLLPCILERGSRRSHRSSRK